VIYSWLCAEERIRFRACGGTFVALCGGTRPDPAPYGEVCGLVRRNASRLGTVRRGLWPSAEERVQIQSLAGTFAALCGEMRECERKRSDSEVDQ
jgi:hypothetical protein